MDASPLIGSSIFLYILAFIAVMAIFAYLTYSISPKGKKRREERRNNRHK
ncbi:hypothetical protein [Psychrobacter frigidicola]|nr:hypothetical protein [Psychrobacter frigidicola]